MAMDREKFLKLVEEYKAKREKERSEHLENFKPQYPYELFGIECGEGWKPLYQPILDYAMEHNIEVHQIKEKFGSLRIYLDSYDDTVRAMIEDAEERSYNVCETCGKHIDKPICENHWIYAECEECHQKWLDKRAKAFEAYENKVKENKAKSESNKS